MNQIWKDCKNILIVRADNMGDIIMSTPAIRALKDTFGSRITLLTSSMGKIITDFIPEIDEVIVYDIPWVKSQKQAEPHEFGEMIEKLKKYNFDASVIFTVCSQNPLPAAMLTYLAGIPRTLAYCRENPYHLVSHWVPEKEPYTFIQHQVERDLNLVASVGADISNNELSLEADCDSWTNAQEKLKIKNIDITKPFFVFHPGVSEEKRQYPVEKWIELVNFTLEKFQLPVLLTGSKSEKGLTDAILTSCHAGAFSLAGELTISEFISLIKNAHLVISVNTGTIHIAAALKTPVIVLYALSNPQHLPWKCTGKAFYYNVPDESRSRNEVIRYMHEMMADPADFTPSAIILAIEDFIKEGFGPFPPLVPLKPEQG